MNREEGKIGKIIKNSPLSATYKESLSLMEIIEKYYMFNNLHEEVAKFLEDSLPLTVNYCTYLKTQRFRRLDETGEISRKLNNVLNREEIVSNLIQLLNASSINPLIEVILSNKESKLPEQYFNYYKNRSYFARKILEAEKKKKKIDLKDNSSIRRFQFYELFSGIGTLIQAEHKAITKSTKISLDSKFEYDISLVNSVFVTYMKEENHLIIPDYLTNRGKSYVFDNVTYSTLSNAFNLCFAFQALGFSSNRGIYLSKDFFSKSKIKDKFSEISSDFFGRNKNLQFLLEYQYNPSTEHIIVSEGMKK